MNMNCNVLIVEDDPLVRKFFANSIEFHPEMTLLNAFGTVGQATAYLKANGKLVDVLLTDLGLPDGSGLEVMRTALEINSQCEPLVISMFGDDASVIASIEAGALGYIHKDAAPDDISKAIIDMRNGESPISPLIARRVLQKFRASIPVRPLPQVESEQGAGAHVSSGAQKTSTDSVLSDREIQVLNLIAQGLSPQEVASDLYISMHTVQAHIKNIYRKLSVNSRTKAIFKASKMGLISTRTKIL